MMSPRASVVVVDAFTDEPFRGNPAAVCLLAQPAPEAWMQAVAAEMNLSETAFAYREGGDWRLRWYTPRREATMCGHATLATAHVLWTENVVLADEVQFRTLSGRLSASRHGKDITLDLPREHVASWEPPAWLVEALGAKAVSAQRSESDAYVELASDADVRALKPDLGALARLDPLGVAVSARGATSDYVCRYFAPSWGLPEDPATGSIQCALGPFWGEKLGKRELSVEQASRRGARMRVAVDEGRVRITGRAVTTLRGHLFG